VPVRPALKHRAIPTKPPEGGSCFSRIYPALLRVAGRL
jgi:hypothetical protein